MSRITSPGVGKMSVFLSITPALNLFHEDRKSLFHEFKLSGSVSKKRGINKKKSLSNVTFIVPQNLLSCHKARLASVGQSDSCTTPHPHATLPPRMGFVHRGKGQLRRTAGHSLGGPNLPPWHASLPAPTLSTPVL